MDTTATLIITSPSSNQRKADFILRSSIMILYSITFLHQLSSRLQSTGSSTTYPQNQVSKLAHVSSPILSTQTIPPFSSRLHQMPLNVCQASTAHPQCSVCAFHGQKPNSRTSLLVYTVTHQTSRWMEIPWSKWTTLYTSAALSPPTAAVKPI